MMRVGLFKPVHVKTLIAQEQRMLLTSRKLVQRELMDIESDIAAHCATLASRSAPSARFDTKRRSGTWSNFPSLAGIIEPLLTVRRVMRQQLATLPSCSKRRPC